jgi:hypothetical protein
MRAEWPSGAGLDERAQILLSAVRQSTRARRRLARSRPPAAAEAASTSPERCFRVAG